MRKKMAFHKRRFMGVWIWVCAVLIGILAAGPSLADDVIFIVNKGVAINSLEKEALRDIFLGNTSVWPDDKKINFAVLGQSETHKAFVRSCTRKTESQFQAWWKRKLFTGTGKIPPRFVTDQEMIAYVAKTEGGLGYVSSKAPLGDPVKPLSVIDK